MARRLPQDIPPAIRRGRVEEVTIFEVKEEELDLLEKGSPESVFLTFASLLLSSAISFSVTFATTEIKSDRTFTVLVVLTVVGYLAGTILLLLWWRSRRSVSSITNVIRRRVQPPEGSQEGGGVVLPEDE